MAGSPPDTVASLDAAAAAAYRRPGMSLEERIRVKAEMEGADPEKMEFDNAAWLLVMTDDEIAQNDVSGYLSRAAVCKDPLKLHHFAKNPTFHHTIVRNWYAASETLHQMALTVQNRLSDEPVNHLMMGQDRAAKTLVDGLDGNPGSRPETIAVLDDVFDTLRERRQQHRRQQFEGIAKEFHPTKNRMMKLLGRKPKPSRWSRQLASAIGPLEAEMRQDNAQQREAYAALHTVRASVSAEELHRLSQDHPDLLVEILANPHTGSETLHTIAVTTLDRLATEPVDDGGLLNKQARTIRGVIIHERDDTPQRTLDLLDDIWPATKRRKHAAASQQQAQQPVTSADPSTAPAGESHDAAEYLRTLAPAAAGSSTDSAAADVTAAARAAAADPGRSATLKASIIASLNANKNLTYQQTANRLKTTTAYVREVASDAGLTR